MNRLRFPSPSEGTKVYAKFASLRSPLRKGKPVSPKPWIVGGSSAALEGRVAFRPSTAQNTMSRADTSQGLGGARLTYLDMYVYIYIYPMLPKPIKQNSRCDNPGFF